MHIVDKPVDGSCETRSEPLVSPYLRRPLRSLDQVLSDLKDRQLLEAAAEEHWSETREAS